VKIIIIISSLLPQIKFLFYLNTREVCPFQKSLSASNCTSFTLEQDNVKGSCPDFRQTLFTDG